MVDVHALDRRIDRASAGNDARLASGQRSRCTAPLLEAHREGAVGPQLTRHQQARVFAGIRIGADGGCEVVELVGGPVECRDDYHRGPALVPERDEELPRHLRKSARASVVPSLGEGPVDLIDGVEAMQLVEQAILVGTESVLALHGGATELHDRDLGHNTSLSDLRRGVGSLSVIRGTAAGDRSPPVAKLYPTRTGPGLQAESHLMGSPRLCG